jgi:hypothetical protein
MNKNILGFIILIWLFSCSSNSEVDKTKAFIEKTRFEDFSEFKNTTIYIRMYRDYDPIVYFFKKYKNEPRYEGPLMFHIDKETGKLLEVKNFLSDSCDFNIDSCYFLARKFVSFGIIKIKSDSNETVRVTLTNIEKDADLVRFKDLKFKSKEYDNYKRYDENWFKNQNSD